MTKLVTLLVALAITLGIQTTAHEPVLQFFDWAVTQLDQIGAQERARQQKIQDMVCAIENISPCPTVPPWVPAEEQIRRMNPPLVPTVPPTTTTTLPEVDLGL